MPNTRPADKAELAWSSPDVLGDEDVPEGIREKATQDAVVSQSWSATLRIAGLLVVGGLVLAGAIWALTPGNSPPKAAPTQGATSTAASASTATPTSITSTKDQDESYMQALSDKGITGLEPEKAIATGKQVCQDMYRGVKLATEIDGFREQQRAAHSYLLADHAEDFVNTSIHAYCPQFGT